MNRWYLPDSIEAMLAMGGGGGGNYMGMRFEKDAKINRKHANSHHGSNLFQWPIPNPTKLKGEGGVG